MFSKTTEIKFYENERKKKLPPECGTFDKRNLETINFVGWNKKK